MTSSADRNRPPSLRGHWVALLRRLTIAVAGIVLLVMLGVYLGLARRERETLVSSKVTAATTVLHYLAVSLTPAVVFGDYESAAQDVERLPRNDDLLTIDVWADEAGGPRLVASADRRGTGAAPSPPLGRIETVSISSDEFIVSTPIVDAEGARPIGVVRATFSLTNVNAAIAANTRRTLWICSLVAFGVAVALLLAIGQSLLRPMREMRMARELEIAAEIQRALLPKNPTHEDFEFAGRMVPADEVGGDFFDVQSDNGSLWITVGDVSGHGLPAGLVMVLAQAAFAAHFRAAPEAEAAHVFRTVNELLWENVARRLRDDKYVTCQLLTYRGDGKFAIVGGHQSLLVYRAASKSVELIDAPGPWLGILQNLPPVETHMMQLEPGDVLCLYSDGVIEARNERDQLYDLPRLRERMAATFAAESRLEVALEDMFDDVLKFCDRPQDDASLLFVRRKAQT